MTELAIEMERRTDVGRKRQHNEDFIDFYEPDDAEELARGGRLYVVADGVGGAAAGEVASEYAAGKVLHEYYRSAEADLEERLRAAIGAANADIFEHVEQRPELGRMGTTIVVAAVRGDEVVVANVGDSRAYLIRNGEIHQITRDHSLVARLVEEGSITSEEAEHHPRRNVVLRSLGVEPDVHTDTYKGRLQPGDQIVLCSDGLTRHVSDEEIMSIATRTRVEHAVKQLVDLANARGGKDNISVLLLRATEAVAPATPPGVAAKRHAPVQPELDAIRQTAFEQHEALPLRRPRRAWRALGGVVGVLVLLIAANLVLRALGILPALMSPIPTPSSVLMLPGEETVVSQHSSAMPNPTASPIPTLTAVPTPTSIPTLFPVSIPAKDSKGDVVIYETSAPADLRLTGLDIRNASVGSNLQVMWKTTDALSKELAGWAQQQEGAVVLWIARYERLPDSLPVEADWLFVLDLDGNEATGRQQRRPINTGLGDEAAVSIHYDPLTGRYSSNLLIWDPDRVNFVTGPDVHHWMSEDRTLLALAVPLDVLQQEVFRIAGVTMKPDSVQGRAAAIAYTTPDWVADLYPDLP